MAAIDKLYADYWDCKELVIWCVTHKPSLLRNMYEPFDSNWKEPYKKRPVANFNRKQDRYLYWHCPLDFVREYLREQCGYRDNWFVKLFWRE